MKLHAPTALVLALATAFPALAQGNEELLKELRALRDRVTQLEQKLQQQQPAPVAAGQWGMTPDQARELNRLAVKAEALQDNFTDQGFKGLKVTGQMDPTWIYNKRQGDSTFVFLNKGDPPRYTYDNSYFGMAVLDFEKETESGARWKLTLAPERGTGSLINGGSIIHEASVSIPMGDMQTRLWLGQIPDWTGYELTLPAGNKLITHNPVSYTHLDVYKRQGQDLADLPPYQRPMNMMFQSYALFPHLTVWENIAFGLKREGLPGDKIRDRVEAMLKLV